MRKLVVAAFTSLDGVIQGPGGPDEDVSGGFALGGWVAPFFTDETSPFMGVFDEPLVEPFDLLLGRRTYDIFASYWPHHQEHPIGPLFDRVTKYVATSRPESLDWVNSVDLTADVPAEIARLKAGDGPMLLTQGSSILVHQLFRHGLVDELRLMTFPVVLGQGKRWFDGEAFPSSFALEQHSLTSTGVISTLYRPTGPVQTGGL